MPRRSKRDTDGLYRRPDSPFWWISYSDGRGGATRRSSGIPVTEDPAGLKAAALRAAWLAAQGEAPTGPDPRQVRTFDELLLAYMREVTPQKGVPERDRYTARHLQPVFTGKPLSQIGVAEVRAYLKSRQAEGAMAGTINKEVGLMSAAINWANRELEWGIPNPWMARRQQEPAGRTRWLTEEEVDRRCRPWRAKRRPVVPGRRRRERAAGGA